MTDMNETNVSSWEEFEQKLPELQPSREGRHFPLLFRGQSDSDWALNTSLERYGGRDYSYMDYFGLVCRIRPQIETYTNNKWEMLSCEEVKKWTTNFSATGDGFPASEYMMYLRHYGFPSPLLDWTESSKIAAYFAFRSPNEPASKRVSIYVFSESPTGMKSRGSNRPEIFNFGRLAARHHRHFLQQSNYTVCMDFSKCEWRFAEHQKVVNREPEPQFQQDVVWKFNIPWLERAKVLKLLDEYNLNAHSLFGSEESLMETLAFREIDLKT
ncbi:MAG: FRG domain-containing protein [Pseudomonadota bacterium]